MASAIERLVRSGPEPYLPAFSSAATDRTALGCDGSPGPSAWATPASGPPEGVGGTGTLERLAALRPVILMLFIACVSTIADARRAIPRAAPPPLETMAFEDAESAGAVGTGCTWRGGPGLTNRFSMADDRAAVKRNGRVVAMKPAMDAKALFLTYDRWVGGGMRIVVRDTGKVVRRGHEFLETIARLDLVEGARTTSFPGRLNCGS